MRWNAFKPSGERVIVALLGLDALCLTIGLILRQSWVGYAGFFAAALMLALAVGGARQGLRSRLGMSYMAFGTAAASGEAWFRDSTVGRTCTGVFYVVANLCLVGILVVSIRLRSRQNRPKQ